jgi:hypothetical protein
VVTTGDSFADLIRHARDALANIVDAMQKAGGALPKSVEDKDGVDYNQQATATRACPRRGPGRIRPAEHHHGRWYIGAGDCRAHYVAS